MTRRARLLFGSAALVLSAVSHQPAHAAGQCLLPTEQTAFDVRVLQTQMMIAGLTCGQHDEYKIFVQRHQPALADADRQIGLHFRRLYGAAGEEQHDAYITDLANAQSQEGMHQGLGFCPGLRILVLQALTLQDADEISRFVTDKRVTNPYLLAPCQQASEPDEAPDKATDIRLRKLIRSLNAQSRAK